MVESPAVIKDLLSLAAASLGAEDAELAFVDESGAVEVIHRVGTHGSIGGDWSTGHHFVRYNRPAENDDCYQPWVGSSVAISIGGPSAESGWLVIAHPESGRFDDFNASSLEPAGRLVEHCLDREVERTRFDEIGMELREHQRKLRSARDQLELSNRELEQFAYIAAHELVSPLRAVAIYAEVLVANGAQPGSDDKTIDYAAEIRSGVSQMTEQVQHLLALSRNHDSIEELEPVGVSEVVQAALDTLAEPIEECGAQVTVAEMPVVHAKAVPLQSVFANLFTNAIRYRRTDQPLEVAVTATRTPTGLRVSVADNGSGIGETDRTRVFEMFERASSDVDGSGIGLALSRRILDVFNARIGVDENDSGGATVWLEFPEPSDEATA